MKQIYLILTLLVLAAIPASAQADVTSITNQLQKVDTTLSFITPGHILYDVKIAVEDFQEFITLDPTRKVLLKQAHLNARIKELEQNALMFKNQGASKNNRNTLQILQKLQIKRMEIDASLEDLKPRCVDIETGEVIACKDFEADSSKKKIYDAVKQQNVDVLSKLIESDKLPEDSKVGLTNAIEKSGLNSEIGAGKKTITANMVQTYRSTAISYIPFSTAMIKIKGTNKQYAIVLGSNEVTISDEMILSSPDYYIYPTQLQMNELTDLAKNINSKKKLSWQHSIKLMNLWMNIEKKAGG